MSAGRIIVGAVDAWASAALIAIIPKYATHFCIKSKLYFGTKFDFDALISLLILK